MKVRADETPSPAYDRSQPRARPRITMRIAQHACRWKRILAALAAGWCCASAHGEKTELRVGGDHNYPPFEFVQDGQPTGFNVELMLAVCRAIGQPVRIELGPWRDVRRQLEDGELDAVCGMAYSSEREALLDFCAPHAALVFDLFVPAASSIRSLEDARDRVIAVQEGGRMHDLLLSMGLTARIATRRDVPALVQALSRGRFDGALLNKAQALFFIEKMRISGLRAVDADLPSVPYAIAVSAGRTNLLMQLNEGLNIVRASGEYRQIHDRWLGPYEQPRGPLGHPQLFVLMALAALLLALSLGWSWSLRSLVRRRTTELRQIIDLVPHMVFAKDLEGRFLLVNQSFAQSHGMDVRQMAGRRHVELPGTNMPEVLRQLREDRQVIEEGQPRTTPQETFTDARGQQRILQTTRVPFASSLTPLPAVLGISVDITDIVRAERALRESEENLAITLNSIGEAVLATDAQGRLTRMNPAAERLTGWPLGEALGMRWEEVLSLRLAGATELAAGFVDDLLAAPPGRGLSRHLLLCARDGVEREVVATGAPMRDREQNVEGAVLVFRDVTEERRVEDRLREAEKMESVGRLAGGIAHDFNNILGGIMGFAELITLPGTSQEESGEHARHILRASERARDMIQKLLAYSRRSPRRILPVDLHALIQDVTSLLRHTLDKRIEIELQLEAAHATVMGDPTQLQSALMNLAVNARDAMPQGGTLTLSTYVTVLKEDVCLQHAGRCQPGPYVVIAVSDTGVGMDQKVMDHLFEPFFTTKEAGSGTGLGLAAVQGTVNDHGGLVTAESVPHEGTTFRIFLPQSDDIQAADEAPPQAVRTGSDTILLVDDEDVILHTTGRMLADMGYKVLTANSGAEAIELVRKRDGDVDLVILDMVMPGMDGAQTLAALREIKPDVRVVLSSGFMRGYQAEDLMARGVREFLQKPYRKSQLSEKVADALAD